MVSTSVLPTSASRHKQPFHTVGKAAIKPGGRLEARFWKAAEVKRAASAIATNNGQERLSTVKDRRPFLGFGVSSLEEIIRLIERHILLIEFPKSGCLRVIDRQAG